MSGQREKDPARTATAVASAPAIPLEQAGRTLGVYQLERELGAGAMGVVYAAFDPELARRIAIKVVRSEQATSAAKERLLREARAMARLSHPNVVTVYEVGTANGRDFIAMELIHGETLTEWLRACSPDRAAILDAFLAAGRGLAAAHAAGIVHRDFKPRNVLRSHDGRIVVTDFGLACDVNAAASDTNERALPEAEEVALGSPELTATGELLGTPPYMAPEQWCGTGVTAATDQFAYCVALWEALAGERPYRGPTIDDLRRQIACGPAALDTSRIPRWARGLLRRGLDPDPARRWSSMAALLLELAGARSGRLIVRAVTAAIALTIAAMLSVVWRPRQAPALGCEPPQRDVASVWAAPTAAEPPASHAAVLETAYARWSAACAAPPQVKPAQMHCLAGVSEWFDAPHHACARAAGSSVEAPQ